MSTTKNTRNVPAKTADKAIAAAADAAVPAFLQGMMNDTRGSEEVTASDITIPRIELCQALSKCRKKNEAQYIEGIEEGDLYNSVTRQVYGPSIDVIPVYYRKEYLLWRDQELGGGFGGAYPTFEMAEQALKQVEKPEEWEILDTAQQFVLVVGSDGKLEEAVISMAKSKARVSRDWNALIRMAGGPRFSRIYTLEGVAAKNTKNQDFHTLSVKMRGFVDESQFRAAEKIYELIQTGKAGVDYSDADEGTDSEM